MKRFASMVVAVLAIALMSGAALAKPDKANKPAKGARAGKKDAGGVSGVVSSVSGNNIVITTRGKKGAEVTVATDANTKFSGAATALAQIQAGMHVSVTPTSGTAQEVTVQAAGKGGKGGKPKGEKKPKNA